MEIRLLNLSIKDVSEGYRDNQEEGVVGYNGKLNIRPKYQREFIYKDKQRDDVLRTVIKGFPLNVMYWAENDDGTFELLDGQQRTISFCSYINSDYTLENRAFHNLTKDEQNQILNYKLLIYACKGTDKEKLDWFKIINIAGEELSPQELRNAVYTGNWLTDAKKKFSKTNCPAYIKGKDYLEGSVIRQEFLETALNWISKANIEQYMSKNQHSPNANELWLYFLSIIEWVENSFIKYTKYMKGIDWGYLFDKYKDRTIDTKKLAVEIDKLLMDEDVTNKKGIYTYVFERNPKYLNIRAFSDSQKHEAYLRQDGKCNICKKNFDYSQMEGDHIKPWVEGGQTKAENCQMTCIECNRKKGKK